MKLEWLFMAEGFGRDSRQAITAIGINQNVQIAEKLPLVTKRGIFAHITNEAGRLKEGDTLSVTLEVAGPSKRIISAQTSEIVVASVPGADLQPAVDVVAELMLRLHEFGSYSLTIKLSHVDETGNAESVEGEVIFHVHRPPASPTEPPPTSLPISS